MPERTNFSDLVCELSNHSEWSFSSFSELTSRSNANPYPSNQMTRIRLYQLKIQFKLLFVEDSCDITHDKWLNLPNKSA